VLGNFLQFIMNANRNVRNFTKLLRGTSGNFISHSVDRHLMYMYCSTKDRKLGHQEPGIVREFCITFIQVREKSGKTNYLVHISFSLTLHGCCKHVVPFVISKCELYHSG